jgi:hypothetical protein
MENVPGLPEEFLNRNPRNAVAQRDIFFRTVCQDIYGGSD